MRDRAILHIDMNAFYASVAQHLDPSLRGKPVVVAGDPEKRSGIILAKSRQAKAAGVKTADAIWQAKQKCPDLIIVPPDYAAYKRYSTLARLLYYEYTNQVEPFGLDESWIDVTGSLHLFGGDPMLIAQEISERVKEELGLTVSVGVSWNKVFAKLGSDTDPGDGIIEITRDNYKEFAWPMPASEMIYVGPATMKKLHAAGYETIGDLAHAGDYFLKNRFGKIGFMLRSFARGEDTSPVRVMDPTRADVDYVIKGIGNGVSTLIWTNLKEINLPPGTPLGTCSLRLNEGAYGYTSGRSRRASPANHAGSRMSLGRRTPPSGSCWSTRPRRCRKDTLS